MHKTISLATTFKKPFADIYHESSGIQKVILVRVRKNCQKWYNFIFGKWGRGDGTRPGTGRKIKIGSRDAGTGTRFSRSVPGRGLKF